MICCFMLTYAHVKLHVCRLTLTSVSRITEKDTIHPSVKER